MQKDRDPSFDAFRGLAIIAVVAIHAAFPGLSWRYSATGKWNFFFLVACLQLLVFAVPAFVFISGYWMSKKPIKSLADYKTFLIKRFSRIFVPYLFWSLILLGYPTIKTHTVNVREVIFKLLTGGACAGYFFIIMLAQLYIITPLLQYMNRKRYGLILVLILNIISVLALYLSRVYNIIGHTPAALPFYSWIIFYEIGLLAGERGGKVFTPQKMRLFILPAILASLLISELEGMILLLRYDNLGFATKYSSLLYSTSIIFGFLFLREYFRHWPKFLVSIGNYSFGIYLIHMFILGRVANVFQKINIIYTFQPLYQFIVALITISICFVLISITRKLLPKSFCRKVLGF